MEVKNINKNDFTPKTTFGVLGICGIVGNLVARVLKDKGYNVIGSDLSKKHDCKFLNSLDSYDIKIYYESHPEEFFNNSDYIFYPPGISKSLDIFKTIKEKNIPILEIDDIFQLFKPEKPVLGITGTNGKTTTTMLLKFIAYENGLNPSEHNLLDMQGNSDYIPALQSLLKGDVAIIEVGTFGNKGGIDLTTKLSKMDCGIITNITPDHLELGKDFINYADIKGEMIQNLNGKKLIVNSNDPTIMGLIKKNNFNGDLITFAVDTVVSKKSKKQCVCGNDMNINEIISGSGYYECVCGLKNIKTNYTAYDIDLKNNSFLLNTPEGYFEVKMLLEGMHNVFNITGAIVASREFLKLSYDDILKSISEFNSVPGRMEIMGVINDKKVIVDYAHNPGGVETVLKEFKNIYGDFTLILTVSSESGFKGDEKIFDIALRFAKYIIPVSKSSQKVAISKIKENQDLKEKIILEDMESDFEKEGTLGARKEDVVNGFKKSLETDTSTIIAIGEAAVKFKSLFNI